MAGTSCDSELACHLAPHHHEPAIAFSPADSAAWPRDASSQEFSAAASHKEGGVAPKEQCEPDVQQSQLRNHR